MSNNDSEKDRSVVLGLFKFISTSITVISAIVSISSFISRARSLEPTYVYAMPTLSLSGPPKSTPEITHISSPKQSSIIPTDINYYYYDGSVISTEHENSTDQLIITAQFINTGPAPETAELQLLINRTIVESKIATLVPGEVDSISITIPPDKSWNVNPTATALPLSLTSPGMI